MCIIPSFEPIKGKISVLGSEPHQVVLIKVCHTFLTLANPDNFDIGVHFRLA
jgi:hypothetical protein